MPPEPVRKYDPEAIREVIRLLNLALDDCRRLLNEAENAVHDPGQDNRRS